MNELVKDRESVPCKLGDEQLHTHAKEYGYTVRRGPWNKAEKGTGMMLGYDNGL